MDQISPSKAIDYPSANATVSEQLAWQDILSGTQKWYIWLMLAYQDIKLRYRRSVLGPFWITISMAITVYSMGFLYAHLFHIDLNQYYPFLVSGMLTWALLSSAIIDLTDTFIISENLIKQIKLPYMLYIHRVTMRNIIIFLHNFVVMLPIYFIFSHTAHLNYYFFLLIPALFIIYINCVSFGSILAMIGARYRDVSQIIKSLIQVIFFVTPVMWSPAILPPDKQLWIYLNPFYAFVELVRAPLLGQAPHLLTLIFVSVVTILGCYLSWKMFVRYRSRIIYWL